MILRRPRLPRAPQISGASLLVVFGLGLMYPALVGAAAIIGVMSPFSNGVFLMMLAPWSMLLGSKPPLAILMGVLTGPIYGAALSLARASRRRALQWLVVAVIVTLHCAAIVTVLASR